MVAGGKKYGLRLLKETIGEQRRVFTAFVFLSFFCGLLSLLPAELYRFFTDSTQKISQVEGTTFLNQIIVFGFLVAIFSFLSSFTETYFHEWFRLRIESQLRRNLLSQLHKKATSSLDGIQRGDWISRMTGDLSQVESFLTESIPRQIREFAIVFSVLILFSIYGGTVVLFPLMTAIFLAWSNYKIQNQLTADLASLRVEHGNIFQILIENLEGIRTIRSHAAEEFVNQKFERKILEISRKSLAVIKRLGTWIGVTYFSSQILVTICLCVVGWSLLKKELTITDVLYYPFFLGLFYDSVRSITSEIYAWNRYFVEGGRLGEILYEGEEKTSTNSVIDSLEIKKIAKEEFHTVQKLSLSNITLGFSNQAILSELNLDFYRFQLAAVMGPSGIGKSTTLEVLAGIRKPISGEVEVGLKEGEKISFRQKLVPIHLCSYVEQSPYFFEGTLLENLTLSNGGFEDKTCHEKLEDLLCKVGLQEFLSHRGGLNYFLQDRATNLSQGEKYRLAICRALFLPRPFLLLDEPFAALDEKSTDLVIQVLKEEKMRRGIILVTHFLPGNLNLDQVFYLQRKEKETQDKNFYGIGGEERKDFPKIYDVGTSSYISAIQ